MIVCQPGVRIIGQGTVAESGPNETAALLCL
jgi:hypothetical protein